MNKLKILVPIFLLILTHTTLAQTYSASPYSAYGIGDVNQNAFAAYKSMATVTTATALPNSINPYNPASYTSIKFTTIDIGAYYSSNKIDNGSQISTLRNAALSNIAFGFPAAKNWGLSFGLLPYSSLGYRIKVKDSIPDFGGVNYVYQGSGSVSKAYLGNSFAIRKNLSVGFNVAYLFGNQHVIQANEYSDSLRAYNIEQDKSTSISDIGLDYGLQYRIKNSEDSRFIIGVAGTLGKDMNATQSSVSRRYRYSTLGAKSYIDTVAVGKEVSGKIYLPQSISFGLGYERTNKLTAAFDVKYQQWSDYKSFGETANLNNSLRTALGFAVKPTTNAISNYPRFVEYRFGVFSENSYLKVKNRNIKQIGVTAGLGLPLARGGSKINLGVELSRRGQNYGGLISENYLIFNFGITINDKWFTRYKFD